MNDPQKLIDIARQIDPDLRDREQALIDALLVVKALSILEGQEAKPVSLVHIPRIKIPEQIKEAQRELNGVIEEGDKKAMSGRLKRFINKKGVRASSIAREMEVSVSTIHGWLSGKWYPTEKYRERLGQILNGTIQLRPSPYGSEEAQEKENN